MTSDRDSSPRGDDYISDSDSSLGPTTWKEALIAQENARKRLLTEKALKKTQLDKKEKNTGEPIFDDPFGIFGSSSSTSKRVSDEPSHKLRQKEWEIARLLKTPNWSGGHGDIDISKEDFSPTLFMGKVHDKLAYDALDTVEKNLNERIVQHNEKVKVLVKENLDRFVGAKDTLDNIYSNKDALFRGDAVEKLADKYKELRQQCVHVFESMIARKERCEDIKAVLNLLQKFSFVLNLPSDIKANIELKDYKKVVHDYKKSKFFKRRCKSTIFQKTFEEIDKLIEDLRNKLFNQLTVFDCEDKNFKDYMEQQERAIAYLHSLDTTKDPEWFFLGNLTTYISKRLEDCKTKYTVRMNLKKQLVSRVTSIDWNQGKRDSLGTKRDSYRDSEHSIPIITEQTLIQLEKEDIINTERKDNLRYRIIKKLCSLLVTYLTHFWNHAQNILSGKFKKGQPILRANKQGIQAEQEKKITEMLNKIISTFSNNISEAFYGIDKGIAHQPLLCKCVEEIIKCNSAIEQLKMPPNMLETLKNFTADIKKFIIIETWKRAKEEISCLYSQEDWVLSKNHPITSLPGKFNNHILQTIKLVVPFLSPTDELIQVVEVFFLESVAGFADCLHHLAFPDDVQRAENAEKDRQLLMVLSNCTHTRKVLLEDITYAFVEAFKYESEGAYNQSDITAAAKEFMALDSTQQIFGLFNELERLVMTSFVRRKNSTLLRYLRKGIHLSGYDWNKAPPPTKIRSFILEILVELALVHSNVDRITKQHTKKIFQMLYEGLGRLFREYVVDSIEHISPSAAFQLDIEFDFVQKALCNYETETTKQIFNSLRNYLYDLTKHRNDDSSKRVKESIINETSLMTRVQLNCFAIHSGPVISLASFQKKPSFRRIASLKNLLKA